MTSGEHKVGGALGPFGVSVTSTASEIVPGKNCAVRVVRGCGLV